MPDVVFSDLTRATPGQWKTANETENGADILEQASGAIVGHIYCPDNAAFIVAARNVFALAAAARQGGDVKQAPLVSGGGAEGNRPKDSQ